MGKGEKDVEYDHICFQLLERGHLSSSLCNQHCKLNVLLLILCSEQQSSLPMFCNTFELDTHNKNGLTGLF